jgi:hypothetical protein
MAKLLEIHGLKVLAIDILRNIGVQLKGPRFLTRCNRGDVITGFGARHRAFTMRPTQYLKVSRAKAVQI